MLPPPPTKPWNLPPPSPIEPHLALLCCPPLPSPLHAPSPQHPPAGTKALVKLNRVLIDQADAAVISEGEEVTLMDWGNAIVTVRWARVLRMCVFVCLHLLVLMFVCLWVSMNACCDCFFGGGGEL